MFNLEDKKIIKMKLETTIKRTSNELTENGKIKHHQIPLLDENNNHICIKRPKIKDKETMLCELDCDGKVIFDEIPCFKNGDPCVICNEIKMTEEQQKLELESLIERKVAILKSKSKIILSAIKELMEDVNLDMIVLTDENKKNIRNLKLLIKDVIIDCTGTTKHNDPIFYQNLPDILKDYLKE